MRFSERRSPDAVIWFGMNSYSDSGVSILSMQLAPARRGESGQ